MVLTNKQKYNKKYGFPLDKPNSKKSISKKQDKSLFEKLF